MFPQAPDWMPSAAPSALMRTLVVIPTYKNNELTWAVIKDCLREPVAIVVVDNGGDYEKIAEETVIRAGQNLGWLRSNNLAMQRALSDRAWDRIVLLNNDVRLSTRFFAGIVWAEQESRSSIVGVSCANDWPVHRPENLLDGQTLEADAYAPEPRNLPTGACDGIAISIRSDALERVGLFDEKQFGKYGWGATVDFCFRARAAGLRTVVTRAAYVRHIGGGHRTAHKLFGGEYCRVAMDEAHAGLCVKWGRHWEKLQDFATQVQVNAWYDAPGNGLSLWSRLAAKPPAAFFAPGLRSAAWTLRKFLRRWR